MNAPPRTLRCHPALLPLLSLAAFWVLPFSPLLSMAAVSQTRETKGTPRTLAVAGALLCSVYTIGLAAWLVVRYVSLPGQ